MDTGKSYLDRFWFDGDRVVAFVFTESPVTDIYFKVRPGYEFLAEEMADYAMERMPDYGMQQFMLFNGQEFLMDEVRKRGFILAFDYEDRGFDFKNELSYPLPEGFHFVEYKDLNPVKLSKCCWYGFDRGDKGPFENWDAEVTGPE